MRKSIEDASSRKIETKSLMRDLSAEWSANFRNPILTLTLRSQNYPKLYWRTTVSGFGAQKYVDLFSSKNGEYVLEQLSPAMIRIIAEYEVQRLSLNAVMKIHAATADALLIQLKGLDLLQSYQDRFQEADPTTESA